MNKIFIIGGAGYVGSKLVPLLLSNGYSVGVYDLFIYGNTLEENANLKKIKGDIRDLNKIKKFIGNYDVVIHLACISNDPSFDLDPELGKSINFDPFEKLVLLSKEKGIKKFVYASSSSVYGIKDEEDVDETFSLKPLTDYSKFKVMCEEILLRYTSKNFIGCIIRPATVCGYSKRQRLDVVVNILTNLAYHKNEITVFGGNQLRPNININDMSRAYMHILQSNEKDINGEIFNVGYENFSLTKLANLVKESIGKNIEIKTVPTNDNRSYHVSSKKIKQKLNFENKFTIKDAIVEMKDAFEKKLFKNPLENELYFNIKRMKSIDLK
jgi:nucleoside-diphosphate-sugar epimerase